MNLLVLLLVVVVCVLQQCYPNAVVATEAGTSAHASYYCIKRFNQIPSHFVTMGDGNTVMFDVDANQLWSTNGTCEGIAKRQFQNLDDTNNLKQGEDDNSLKLNLGNGAIALKNKFLFVARYNKGEHLFVTDEDSDTVTQLDVNICQNQCGSEPSYLTPFQKDLIFFRARTSNINEQRHAVFATDGTVEGTIAISPQFVGGPSNVGALRIVNQTLFFIGGTSHLFSLALPHDTNWNVTELGRAQAIAEIPEQPYNSEEDRISNLVTLGDDKLFFLADGPNGVEEWISDGTTDGTRPIQSEQNKVTGGMFRHGSWLSFEGFLEFDNRLLFYCAHGSDNDSSSISLMVTDGTSAGTFVVKEFQGLYQHYSGCISALASVSMNGNLYFGAREGENGLELWKTNGTSEGTVFVADVFPSSDGEFPLSMALLEGDPDHLIFTAYHDNLESAIWSTEGSPTTTVLIKNISTTHLLEFLGRVYFMHGTELWSTNGTTGGSKRLADSCPHRETVPPEATLRNGVGDSYNPNIAGGAFLNSQQEDLIYVFSAGCDFGNKLWALSEAGYNAGENSDSCTLGYDEEMPNSMDEDKDEEESSSNRPPVFLVMPSILLGMMTMGYF